MLNIEIQKLPHAKDMSLPNYSTKNCSGLDLYAAIKNKIKIKNGDIVIIPTGIKIALKKNLEGQIRPRSGLAANFGITVLNTPGTIDADYRGEVGVILVNLSAEEFIIEDGERIAQMVIAKHEQAQWIEVEALENSERGAGGFGSTGVK